MTHPVLAALGLGAAETGTYLGSGVWSTSSDGGVLEPIKLHVDAKRYLCAIEPGYGERLSAGSRHSLELQGGPFDPAQATRFIQRPYAADAVALRRWDDRAKDVAAIVPSFGYWRPLLREVSGSTPLVSAK